MNLYIMHAGIGRPSPFFRNFLNELYSYQNINIKVNADLPDLTEPCGIIYFHRTKRFYNSNDMETAINFLKKVDALKKSGWKMMWTIHNFYPIDRKITEVDEYLLEEFLKRMDVIFVFTNFMKNQLLKKYKINAIVHSIGINKLDGDFDKSEFDSIIPKKAFVFSIVGNFTEYKNLDKTIEEFLNLSTPNVHLLIAGSDTRNYKLDENKYGEYENIHIYKNFIGDSDWAKISEITDVFLNIYDLNYINFKMGFFPSNSIQLLTTGKLCIVPESEIFREFFDSTSALFYDFDNDDGLSKSMRMAVDMPNKKIHYVSKTSKYSWRKMSKIIVGEMIKIE